MSQVELSRSSGYSERVIRKAEAGGTLRLETIRDLATAMSVEGHSLPLVKPHETDLKPKKGNEEKAA